jgi:hypothetical protein
MEEIERRKIMIEKGLDKEVARNISGVIGTNSSST